MHTLDLDIRSRSGVLGSMGRFGCITASYKRTHVLFAVDSVRRELKAIFKFPLLDNEPVHRCQ